MKFKFDIECTPEEARAFIGLPDVAPMQERLIQDMEKQLQDNMKNLSPEEMVKTWMPTTTQGFGEMQKIFWSQMGVNMPSSDDDSEKKKNG